MCPGALLAALVAAAGCGDPSSSGGAPGPAGEAPVDAATPTEVTGARGPEASPAGSEPEGTVAASPSRAGGGDAAATPSDASAAAGAPAVTAAPLTELPIVEPTWPAHLREIVAEAREAFRVPTVTVRERAKLPPDLVVVDVRGADEAAVSVVPGARVLDTRAKRRAFLAEAHERPVLVYCTAGWRSAEFTRDLREAGVDAYNLEGGLCAWALYGQRLVDPDGEPTTRVHGYSEEWADCVPAGYEAVW